MAESRPTSSPHFIKSIAGGHVADAHDKEQDRNADERRQSSTEHLAAENSNASTPGLASVRPERCGRRSVLKKS